MEMQFEEIIEIVDRGKSLDVQTTSTFESLMISRRTLERLKAHGFVKPSPVQEKAIPVGLLGRDMLVQAKSGTGKTLVFSVLAVENVDVKRNVVQKMIMAPTREIAQQIKETVKKIAPSGTRIAVFVGGISLRNDVQILQKQCPHIVIGTTGRVCQLASKELLDLSHVDFFVLDEADKLMDDCFQKDIHFLISALPPMRQLVVFSATYPRSLDQILLTFLRDAALVRFNSDDVQLIGIKQYVVTNCVPILESLVNLLRRVQFSQALVFCDMVEKCEMTCDYLVDNGYSAGFISSAMSQGERQNAIEQLTNYSLKILVSSDLTARGIDADRVNLVVNLDTANNPETYFHRIGRAARFGGQGAAVTLLENDKSARCFTALVGKGKARVKRINLDEIPYDLPTNVTFYDSQILYLDLDRDKAGVNQDLVNVPKREEAIRKLNQERGETGEDYRYAREEMLEMREMIANLKIEEGPIENKPEEDKKENVEGHVAVPLKTFNEELELLRNVLANPEVKPLEKEEPEKKPKYKFVPTRQKAKTKFYMRGELLRIRDSVDATDWRNYAMRNFDLTQEPFIDAPRENMNVVKEPTKKKKIEGKKEDNGVEKLKKRHNWNDGVKRYSRHEMIKIQIQVPKDAWLPYIKSRWDTNEEPWELDQSMRCSFEERLRRIRAKEKAERRRIMDEKKKARDEANQLMSSGRTSDLGEITDTSFSDYSKRLEEKFREFLKEEQENGGEIKQRIGPVVPLRDPPIVWNYRVNMYTEHLRYLDAQFKYEMQVASGNSVEKETVMSEEGVTESEMVEIACQTDEIAAACTEENVEYPNEEAREKELDQFNETDFDEYYEDEEDDDTEEDENGNDGDDLMFRMVEQYRRNVDYNIVVNSYLRMMNDQFR